jgi:hypothetical protein
MPTEKNSAEVFMDENKLMSVPVIKTWAFVLII